MRYTFIQAMHMHSWTGLQKVWRGGRAWDCLMRMKLRLSWLGLASSLGWLVTYLHKYVLSYALLPWTPAFVVVDIFKPQVCRLFSFGNNGCNSEDLLGVEIYNFQNDLVYFVIMWRIRFGEKLFKLLACFWIWCKFWKFNRWIACYLCS